MEIDVEIERISNGFIVTGHDSTKTKEYFPSMEKFVASRVIEPMQDTDKYFREHDSDGERLRFTLRIEAV